MYVRGATTRDLPRIATITVGSLVDDPAFDYMWPHRHEYPDDNYFFWLQHLKKELYDREKLMLVVVTELEDLPPSDKPRQIENIISFGIWKRIGTTASVNRWTDERNSGLNQVDASTCQIETWSIAQKYARRDADPRRQEAFFVEADRIIERHFLEKYQDIWIMDLLVTDRPWRRHGAATSIIKWGIAFADAENLPCGVIASPMGKPLYQELGFTCEVGQMHVQVDGDADSLDCAVLLRNPR